MFKLALVSVLLVAVYGAEVRNPVVARVLAQDLSVNPDGSYAWKYETENGIQAGEEGVQKPVPEGQAIAAQGFFRYQAPGGEPVEVRYTADENGFHAEGNAIPQPQPIPPQIQRALEWIAAHPEPEQRPQNQPAKYYQ